MTLVCLGLQYVTLVAARRLLVYWMHPTVILVVIWTAQLTATVLLASEYVFSPSAFAALLLFELAAIAGSAIGFVLLPPLKRPPCPISFRFTRPIAWLSLFLGLVSVKVILSTRESSLASLFSWGSLAEVSRDFSLARYADDFRMPLLARTTQMFAFFGSMVCGAQFALDRKSLRTPEFFLPLIPLVVTAVVMTTRASILFGLFFWLSAFAAAKFWLSERADWKPITWKSAILITFGLLLFTVVFVWLQFLRGGISDLDRLPGILAHLKKWPFGSFAGFSVWYDSPRASAPPSLGFYTFAGFFDLFGVRDRASGLYQNLVDIGDGSLSNIFTVFRGLIEDFTRPGAYAVVLMLGVLSSFATSLARMRKVLGLCMLAALYPFILHSHVVSFYAYLGHVSAIMMFVAFALTCFRRRNSVE